MILPPELVRVRRTRAGVYPRFADEDIVGLAKTLNAIYTEHKDRRRGDLREALAGCEELGYDFKLVRGLSFVLDGRCVFGARSAVPPARIRSILFDEAAKTPVHTEEERKAVIDRVARILEAAPQEVEEGIYADLEDEMRLAEFKSPEPFELLQLYNFALAASVLTHAVRITVEFTGGGDDLQAAAESLGETDTRGIPTRVLTVQLKAAKHVATRGSKVELFLGRLLQKPVWKLTADLAYPPRLDEARPFEMSQRTHGCLIMAEPPREEVVIEVKAKPAKKSGHGEIIVVEELANRMGITDRELLAQLEKEGVKYTRLGGVLYSPARLESIKADLEGMEEGSLKEFRDILKPHGAKNPVAVLESIGYVVEPGDGKEVRVYRIRRRGASSI